MTSVVHLPDLVSTFTKMPILIFLLSSNPAKRPLVCGEKAWTETSSAVHISNLSESTGVAGAAASKQQRGFMRAEGARLNIQQFYLL